jgi:GDP-L-fucose synthase
VEIRNTHINIGTGKDLTIKELAHLIKEIIGFDGLIESDTSKPDGTFQKLLSVKKLHELGWKEKVSLEEGIKMVYQHYTA